MTEIRIEGGRTIIPFGKGDQYFPKITAFLKIKPLIKDLSIKDLEKESLKGIRGQLEENVKGVLEDADLFNGFFRLCPISCIYYRQDEGDIDIYPESYKIEKERIADPKINLKFEGEEGKDLSVLLSFSGPIADWPVFRDLLQIDSALTSRYEITSDLEKPKSSRITVYVNPAIEGTYFLECARKIYEKWGSDRLNNHDLSNLRTNDFRDEEVNSSARGIYAKGLLKHLGIKLE